jgi:hypothetical protein
VDRTENQTRDCRAITLAYNLGNFLRTLATPEPIKDWSLSSLKEKLIKIGAKVISHGRIIAFQMAEVAIPRHMFQEILQLIAEAAADAAARAGMSRPMVMRSRETDRRNAPRCRGKTDTSAPRTPPWARIAGDRSPTGLVLPASRETATIRPGSEFIWEIPVDVSLLRLECGRLVL